MDNIMTNSVISYEQYSNNKINPNSFCWVCQKYSTNSNNSINEKYLVNQEYETNHAAKVENLAGLKLYSAVLLSLYRNRCKDVELLKQQMNNLQSVVNKAKNQLHIYNTLFKVQEKRSEELTMQLKKSMSYVSHEQRSCEDLTTEIISLKTDIALLRQQLDIKNNDYEALNCIYEQTKSELFRSMVEQRNLQVNLCQEERKVQILKEQNTKLQEELSDCRVENRTIEQKYRKEYQSKVDELSEAKSIIYSLRSNLEVLNQQAIKIEQLKINEHRLNENIKCLRQELLIVKSSYGQSKNGFNFISQSWAHFRRKFSHCMRMFFFYMLPALPLKLEDNLDLVVRQPEFFL